MTGSDSRRALGDDRSGKWGKFERNAALGGLISGLTPSDRVVAESSLSSVSSTSDDFETQTFWDESGPSQEPIPQGRAQPL